MSDGSQVFLSHHALITRPTHAGRLEEGEIAQSGDNSEGLSGRFDAMPPRCKLDGLDARLVSMTREAGEERRR